MANSTTNITSYFNRAMEKIQKRAEVVIGRLWREAWSEYIVIADKRLKKEFNEAIQEFYDDYTPTRYNRNESLYDIFKTDVDTTNGTLSFWNDPSKMTGFRNGYHGDDGLYSQVYRRGWHGGADRISESKAEKYGEHPNTGTPYWRYPDPYYTRWGDDAKGKAPIASVSPLENVKRRIKNYEEKEIKNELTELFTKKFNSLGSWWWR